MSPHKRRRTARTCRIRRTGSKLLTARRIPLVRTIRIRKIIRTEQTIRQIRRARIIQTIREVRIIPRTPVTPETIRPIRNRLIPRPTRALHRIRAVREQTRVVRPQTQELPAPVAAQVEPARVAVSVPAAQEERAALTE